MREPLQPLCVVLTRNEAEQIKAAATFCRKYATLPTHRLLSSSFSVWRQTFDRVANAKQGEWSPELAEGLLGGFVGWLLIWRLVLDHAAHDLSSRFGKPSEQLSRFRAATHKAYDTSQAYRLVEALRNLVQHQVNIRRGSVRAQVRRLSMRPTA